MSILIKGMEIPKRGESCLVITITPDGEVYKNVYDASFRVNQVGEAISVPPHGRLIDADALEADLNIWHGEECDSGFSEEAIDTAPTIILAEEESK